MRNLRLKDNGELQALLARSKVKLSGAAAPAALGGVSGLGKRSNKFNARRCQVDGINFDSVHESERYLILKQRMKTGEIKDLVCHCYVAIEVKGVHVSTLIVDFRYQEKTPGTEVWREKWEDAKGYKRGAAFELFKLKAALVGVIHKINVEIV